MTNDYSAEADLVGDAMDAVYENKQTNKKSDISGDFSSDSASYPTVKAVKDRYEGNGTVKNAHTHGNITTDGKIGNVSDKIVVTGTNGALDVASTIPSTAVTNGALTHIGTSNGATQSTINTEIDKKVNITVEKLSTAETGYASSYVIKQNGSQVGATINVMKDKMLRSISVETVGSTPTSEETAEGMTTGDKYLKFVVNTTDNDGTTNVLLPLTSVFDLQTADGTTLELSNNGVFSIKNKGVTKAKLADEVSAQWISDANIEIGLFATALANRINPPSSP